MKSEKGIIFFDGVCNLCNGFVQTIIKLDKNDFFRFASLQSNVFQDTIAELGLKPQQIPDSIVYIEHDRLYVQEAAVFKIAKHLGYPYKILSIFSVFPNLLTKSAYKWVARNRYQLFGKQTSCWMPTAALKKKFLS